MHERPRNTLGEQECFLQLEQDLMTLQEISHPLKRLRLSAAMTHIAKNVGIAWCM